PGLNASIDPNLQLLADRLGNCRQSADRRRRSIQLAPAMIGDDKRISTDIHSNARILYIHDALEYQFAVPETSDPAHIIPTHGRVKLLAHPLGERRDRFGSARISDNIAEGSASRTQHRCAPARPTRHA